jgi:GrpB-like predicted nucleotidyltransferase (UPF0157 family)
MGAMSHERVVIVDPDPAWPARFTRERAALLAALGEWIVDVQHVGSTAVPGLAAKPIVDLMVGVRSLADAPACIGPLRALSYEYVPELEDAMPFRRYFRKPVGGRRAYQLHMVEPTHEFWDRHLRFRDRLRADRVLAAAYADLKRELAARHGHDRHAYTEAKTPFIEAVLAGRRPPGLSGG